MTQDNLVKFQTPETSENFSDALSDLIRKGAQQIIAQAVEAELNELPREHQTRDGLGSSGSGAQWVSAPSDSSQRTMQEVYSSIGIDESVFASLTMMRSSVYSMMSSPTALG